MSFFSCNFFYICFHFFCCYFCFFLNRFFVNKFFFVHNEFVNVKSFYHFKRFTRRNEKISLKNCIAFMRLKLQKQQNENNENLHYLFLRRRFVARSLLNFRIKFDARSNSFFENH